VQKKRRLEPFGYQPNNPLTIYYKKYIEKEPKKKTVTLKHIKNQRYKNKGY